MQNTKRIVILLVILCTSNQFIHAVVLASDKMEYFAVFIDGHKAGYYTHHRMVKSGKVTTIATLYSSVNYGGTVLKNCMTETNIETLDGEPLGFECVQDFGNVPMIITGEKNEKGRFDVVVKNAGVTTQNSMDWPEGTLMLEGIELLCRRKGLKEGTVYTTRVFNVLTMQVMEAELRVKSTKEVDLLGKVVTLTEMVMILKCQGSEEVRVIYIDDKFNMQKLLSPRWV